MLLKIGSIVFRVKNIVYQNLFFSFGAALVVAFACCLDDKNALPSSFQFVRFVENPPFKLEVELLDGKQPKRGEGKMVIDGVVTTAIWPGNPPRIYKLNNEIFLIHDHYHGKDFIWNNQKKELRNIGRLGLETSPMIGTVCFRHNTTTKPPTVEVCDFDATKGEPRVLYQGSVGQLIGKWKNGMLIWKSKTSVVSLQPGEAPEELTFDLDGFNWASNDAIRGNRGLLTKTNPAVTGGQDKPIPYEVEVAILDLTTKRIKSIGSFKGGWRVSAMFHPSYSVQWITAKKAKLHMERNAKSSSEALAPEFEMLFGRIAQVVEGTENLLK